MARKRGPETATEQVRRTRRNVRHARTYLDTPEMQKGGPMARSTQKRADQANREFLRAVRRKKAAKKAAARRKKT